MNKIIEKFARFLYEKYQLNSNKLAYVRIFAAPWLALLISRIIFDKNLVLAIIILVLFLLVIETYFIGAALDRLISKESYPEGRSTLDKISYKILIVFLLIPFSFNLYTFLIILAESFLAFHDLNFSTDPRSRKAEKLKLALEVLLIIILILQTALILPDVIVYGFIIVTIISVYYSLYTHYFYFKKE